jgi:hypothetical protein
MALLFNYLVDKVKDDLLTWIVDYEGYSLVQQEDGDILLNQIKVSPHAHIKENSLRIYA